MAITVTPKIMARADAFGAQRALDTARRAAVKAQQEAQAEAAAHDRADRLAAHLMEDDSIRWAIGCRRIEVAVKRVDGQWVAQVLVLDREGVAAKDWLEVSPTPLRFMREVFPRMRWETKESNEEGRVLLSSLEKPEGGHPYDTITETIVSYMFGHLVRTPFEGNGGQVINGHYVRCPHPVI